jgi:hypothetical protein
MARVSFCGLVFWCFVFRRNRRDRLFWAMDAFIAAGLACFRVGFCGLRNARRSVWQRPRLSAGPAKVRLSKGVVSRLSEDVRGPPSSF